MSNRQQQHESNGIGLLPISYGSVTYSQTQINNSNENQLLVHNRRTMSPMHNKPNNIQFINETDSIIADSNGRIFSGVDSPSSMTSPGAAHHGSKSTMGMAGVKRPMTSQTEYFLQSDDSYSDSYEDEIDQLVYTSRDSRRRPEGIIRSNVSSAMNEGPRPGKKTKGRVKIKMEFIENKLRRYTTFSKRKTGIMKKAYELSTLTGTQVMLLVASETGHVYTFATRKLQPMITSDSGKALIQTCLNSPDIPTSSASSSSSSSSSHSSASPDLPPHGRDADSPNSRRSRVQRPTSRHQPPSTSHDSALTLTSDPALKFERTSSITSLSPTLLSRKQCTQDNARDNNSRQQSECVNKAKSDDDESRATSASNDIFKRNTLSQKSPAVANGISSKLTTDADAITTQVVEQKSVSLLPTEKNWFSPSLLYKLPGSNQIISLPALKAPNGSGTLIYQTPQGLLLASPSSLVGALTSDGSVLTSPAAATMCHQETKQSRIDVRASLISNVSRSVAAENSQNVKNTSTMNFQSTPTDLRYIGHQLGNVKR